MPPVSIGRRNGGIGAAAVLLAAPIIRAAAVQPVSSDAALLGLCREYLRLHEEEAPLRVIMHSGDDEAGERAYDYCDKHIWDRQWELADQITGMQAKTPEDLRGKALVAKIVLQRAIMTNLGETFDEQADPHEKLVMSLIQDMESQL